MHKIESIEEDLYWIRLMLHFTEKAMQIKSDLDHLDRSTISDVLHLSIQDGLASTVAHIGEQLDTNKLSEEIKHEFDEVPWSEIKRFRDKHNHWYQGIQHEIVESIVDELPELYDQLKHIEKVLEDRLSEY